MTRNKGEKTERLAAEVKRQFGAEATTRFLRTLPAWKAAPPAAGAGSQNLRNFNVPAPEGRPHMAVARQLRAVISREHRLAAPPSGVYIP
jgi:hypothetical protein